MSEEKLAVKDIVDLKKIILHGNRNVEDYTVEIYKEVYDKDLVIKIRGLSNYEYDQISLEMYEEIKDEETIDYIFNKSDKEIEETIDNEESGEKEPKINEIEISKAYLYRNVLIVFYAMKDFVDGLTINIVKQMEGINDIAKRVNEKSGRTKEILQKISFFREKQRKP